MVQKFKCEEEKETSGKDFRISLRKPLPGTPASKRPVSARIVPAFTIQSLQRNVKVQPFPRYDIFEPKAPKDSQFKIAFLSGEFPISIENVGKHVCWKVSTIIQTPVFTLRFKRYILKILI